MGNARIRIAVASLLGATTYTGVCSAAEEGVELGLRSGYAIPFGKVTDDAREDMNEGISGAISSASTSGTA